MKFEGTIELIKESSKGLSTGDWTSIIVSVVALLGVIISTVVTVFSNKKIAKSRTTFEEEQNNKIEQFQKEMKYFEIDKNIMANARIEWIQSVRNESKDFIINFYSDMEHARTTKNGSYPSEEFKKSMYNLIMYLGPDSLKIKENNIYFDIVKKEICYRLNNQKDLVDYSRVNNDEINNLIVGLIKALNENLCDYMSTRGYNDDTLRIKNLFDEYEQDLMELEDGNENMPNELFEMKYANRFSIDVDEFDNIIYVPLTQIGSYLQDIQREEQEKKKKNKDNRDKIDKEILNFVEVMRTYLKIEWKNVSDLETNAPN